MRNKAAKALMAERFSSSCFLELLLHRVGLHLSGTRCPQRLNDPIQVCKTESPDSWTTPE